MTSKFFTNTHGNTLFDKFHGIAEAMVNFYSFHAVVGYFRSSGYFKLRKELDKVEKIQILIGINIDDIFRKHNKAYLMFTDEKAAKELYVQDFIDDVKNAQYSAEVEEGILQLCEDLCSGKVEMKIHPSKNLHAKFYLCLPEKHSEHSDGWVVMGSSNISESGLGITQPPRYELNVAMKDFDDVNFCKHEFDNLWKDGIVISAADIDKCRNATHLRDPQQQPTPYELYIKMLIDTFGDQVEDDFSIALPDGVVDLKYQKDAVIQGYQMMMRHNGFFLADVVGLGKTMIATMIAKRFIEANGRSTKILVIYPPALENNWKETFKKFGIDKKAQFISNGSLSYIIDGINNYFDKEYFDVVIVDEAHNFRSQEAGRYDELQKICKSPRNNRGLVKGNRKKIMLLSATPLNNSPEDLRNLIALFQDMRRSSIDGVCDLQAYFAPQILEYKRLMKKRNDGVETEKVDELYGRIRNKVLDKVTVRRTRSNILNDKYYKEDLKRQNINFPTIEDPIALKYDLGEHNSVFFETMKVLTDDKEGVTYARYRAVSEINDPKKIPKNIKNPKNIGENLKGIYRTHMVKRLESSFFAFKKSLDTFIKITNDMIKMFEDGRVIIAPELKIKNLMAKGWEIDKILK